VANGETAAADADYRAALAHLGATISGGVVAAGYSFGAATAVRVAAADPRVRGLLLVAPPPTILAKDKLRDFPGPVLLVAGEIDPLAPAAELERIADDLPRGSLHVIPAADHFFATGLGALGRISAAWFALSRA
jgi:pimeloyl-ACP methyl ester carboxylesterase